MANTVRNTTLVGVLVMGLAVVGLVMSNGSGYQNYQESKTLDAANAKTLEVSSSDVNVHVHPGTGDKVAANFSGRGESGAYQLITDVQGDRVHVEVNRIHRTKFLFQWNSNFQADLSVDSGNVKVGFPAQWSVDDEHHKVGTVGTGGPHVKVTTNSGNIELAQR